MSRLWRVSGCARGRIEAMKVLVVTIVHDPRDARIAHRQIPALVAAGHDVTFAAPFSAYGASVPDGVRPIDLPRSQGRRRLNAVREARRMIGREAPAHDVILLHDPELLVAVEGVKGPVVVWDVHEDTAAALTLKSWLPKSLRGVTASGVQRVERLAENRYRLILAEDGYRERFGNAHPVVPNSTPAPETVVTSGDERVVYVGAITQARGASDMIELGRLLSDHPAMVHLIGSVAPQIQSMIEAAHAEGAIVWHGFLPNDQALAFVDGALAGLSLLHDEPNYRHSRPTKVIEYMAHGVPVICTPTPPAQQLVDANECGLVVGFKDPAGAAAAVRMLAADPISRQQMADNGRAAALRDHDWNHDGEQFARVLEQWVNESA